MSEIKVVHSVELDQKALAKIAYVSNFASTKNVNSYINCVCLINKKGLVAVATNGHCLSRAVLTGDTIGEDFEILIPIDFVLNILNKYKEKYGTLKLQVVTNGDYEWLTAIDVQTEVTVGSTTFGALSGVKFPNWQRVMPDEDVESVARVVAINPAYLALLNKAYKCYRQHDKSLTEMIITRVLGEGKPIVFDCAEANIKTIIMPMRNWRN